MAYSGLPSHDLKGLELLIGGVLRRGLTMRVDDGEGYGPFLRNKEEMMDALGNTEIDNVALYTEAPRNRVAVLTLVYYNGPGELVADHTDNELCRELVSPIQELDHGL